MIGGSPDIAIVEAHQYLPGANALVIGDQNVGDESGDVRRDRGDVSAHIGIVGACDETPRRLPVVTVTGRRQGSNTAQGERCELRERPPRSRLRGDLCAPLRQCVHVKSPQCAYAPMFSARIPCA